MATRAFLNPEQIHAALEMLCSPAEVFGHTADIGFRVSQYCQNILLKRFEEIPDFKLARPVKLGSWSRDELCVRSDIDLLFFGPEKHVKGFVSEIQKQGLKIRARVPEDLNDWTVGVEEFDVMALLSAKAFYAGDEAALILQKEKINTRLVEKNAAYRKELYQALKSERLERAERYDSISNYLEPNLKYAPGGIRDLEQALMTAELFAPRFVGKNEGAEIKTAISKLKIAKRALLILRHFCHLSGGNDVFMSQLQFDCAKKLKFESAIELMSFVSKLMADVSFYADVVDEVLPHIAKSNNSASAQNKAKGKTDVAGEMSLGDAVKLLIGKSSMLNQLTVRESKVKLPESKQLAKIWWKEFNSGLAEKTMTAFVRSRLLDKVVPDFAKIRGLVQHDQYHRYSCDAHTLQALKGVLRTKKSKKILGPLSKTAQGLKSKDWDILLIAALFHDMGKGRDGDHATIGEKLAKKYLTEQGLRLRETIEIAWLVKNHLLMSSAAFRMNPKASSTWAELFKRGVRGERIARLAVFTAIDIQATNPEAWNEWKARLLAELVESMQSKMAGHLDDVLMAAQQSKVKLEKDVVEQLDIRLFAEVPSKELLKDLQEWTRSKGDMAPIVVKGKGKDIWIRFHSKEDRPGLFKDFCTQLLGAGVGVQEAFATTDARYGAYDWFKVKSSKSIQSLRQTVKRLGHQGVKSSSQTPNVQFAVIDVVSKTATNVVLSFRGKDQKGALLAATKALFDAGFEIQSAKVHTWGRQIDDVFTVRLTPEFDQALAVLRKTLVVQNSVNL